MQKGFTLLELMVVLIILGVLVSLGMPQYAIAVEKARTAEAISLLGAIRSAQLRYAEEHDGNYKTFCKLDGSGNDCSGIDIDIPLPRFFTVPWAHKYNTTPPIVGAVSRNDVDRNTALFGNYVLYIADNGNICCNDSGVSGTCDRLGIPVRCTNNYPPA